MDMKTNKLENNRVRLLILFIIFLFWNLVQYLYFISFFKNLVYTNLLFSFFIIFIVLYLGYSFKETLLLNGLFLILCPILVIIKKPDFSNYIAVNIAVLSILSVLLYLISTNYKYQHIKKNKGKKNIFKYLSLFFIACFLFGTIFLNLTDIKVSFFRRFYAEKYFKEIEVLNVDGKNYYNKMDFSVEIPKNYFIIDDLFTIEGWAIDDSELAGAHIDYVYVYLDNKPQDGGEFVCKCEYGKAGKDIATIRGEEFKNSGFFCEIDSNDFKDGLREFYICFHSNYFGWKYVVVNLFINNEDSFVFEDMFSQGYGDIEFQNSELSTDGKEIIIKEGEKVLKSVKIPVNIESDKDYLVSLEIRKTKDLDGAVHFDFFGDGYDNSEQEFALQPYYIDENYKKVNQLLNSSKIPSNTNIYFRIFTYSSGSFVVKNLVIYEIDE